MQQVVEGKASASDGTTLKGCSGDIRLLLEQDSPPDDLDVMALFSGRWPNKCSFSSGPLDLDPAFFHTRSFCQVLESRLKVSFVWGEVVVAWMRERERECARARARAPETTKLLGTVARLPARMSVNMHILSKIQ